MNDAEKKWRIESLAGHLLDDAWTVPSRQVTLEMVKAHPNRLSYEHAAQLRRFLASPGDAPGTPPSSSPTA